MLTQEALSITTIVILFLILVGVVFICFYIEMARQGALSLGGRALSSRDTLRKWIKDTTGNSVVDFLNPMIGEERYDKIKDRLESRLREYSPHSKNPFSDQFDLGSDDIPSEGDYNVFFFPYNQDPQHSVVTVTALSFLSRYMKLSVEDQKLKASINGLFEQETDMVKKLSVKGDKDVVSSNFNNTSNPLDNIIIESSSITLLELHIARVILDVPNPFGDRLHPIVGYFLMVKN